MKNLFISMFLALCIISTVGMVSASTVISGKIYDGPNFETANGVSGANINVTCGSNVLYTTSQNDGTYSVTYNVTDNCPDTSSVTVWAEKDGFSNSGTGTVHDYTSTGLDLYIGVVNIALIPEFGAMVGILTVLSAIGVFFVIRRK